MEPTEKEEIVDDDYIGEYLETHQLRKTQSKQVAVLENKEKNMRSEIIQHFKLGESQTDNYDVVIKESLGTRIAPKDRAKEILIAHLGDEEGNRVYHRLLVNTHRILTSITNRLT